MKFDGYHTLVDVSALEFTPEFGGSRPKPAFGWGDLHAEGVNKFDNMVKAGTELS